jgi:hypothetical protein
LSEQLFGGQGSSLPLPGLMLQTIDWPLDRRASRIVAKSLRDP